MRFIWLPTGFVVILALLGMVIFARTLERPLRLRRAALGLLLMTSALLGWVILAGGLIPMPRAVVIAYPDNPDPIDLEAAVATLGRWDQVAFLRLQTGTAPAGAQPPWDAARSAELDLGQDRLALLAAIESRARVSTVASSGDWSVNLVEAAVALLDQFSFGGLAPLFRPTLLVVHGPGDYWSERRLVAFDLSRLIERLNRPRATDVFVLEAPSRHKPGRLELVTDHEVLPAARVGDYGTAQVVVRLTGCPYRVAGSTYQFAATIDHPESGAVARGSPHFFTLTERPSAPDPDPGQSEVARFKIGDFQPAAERLEPGLHRLRVTLKVPRGATASRGVATYEAVRYLQIEERRLVLLGPTNGLGRLTRPSWARWADPDPLGSAQNLIQKFLKDRYVNGESWRTDWSPESVVAHPLPVEPAGWSAGALDLLTKDLNASRTLVLFEPDLAQLDRIGHDLNLGERIKDGLSVLVVGPPPPPTPGGGAPTWPAWLPCASRPALAPTGATGTPKSLLVERDRRLYFCLDQSRPLSFRPGPDGLNLQRRVVNRICEILDARDDWRATGTAVRDWLGVADGRLLLGAAPKPLYATAADGTLLTLFPPLAIDVPTSDRAIREIYLAQPAAGAVWDTVPSSVGLRLEALTRLPDVALVGPRYLPITPNHLHPGSTVVVFVADLPHAETVAALKVGDHELKWRVATTATNSRDYAPVNPPVDIAALAALGVRVHVVRVGGLAAFRATYVRNLGVGASAVGDVVNHVRTDAALKSFVEPPLDLDSATVESVARTLASRITGADIGRMTRKRTGRIIDERGAVEIPAPESHTLLLFPEQWKVPPELPTRRFEPDHAVIAAPVIRSVEAENPAIVSRTYREGSVTVMAYSPLAADVWRSDRVGSDWPGPLVSRSDRTGWGVQRIIDLVQLTGGRRTLARLHPSIRAARVAEDGATLWLDCWADLGRDDLRPPILRDLATRNQVGPVWTVHSADVASQTLTYQFRPDAALDGDFLLDLAGVTATPGGPADPESTLRINLSLRAAGPSGRDVKEALARLAQASGGAVLPPTAQHADLAFARPSAWLLRIFLCLAILLMLSPLARPWPAWARWGEQKNPASRQSRDDRPIVRFDLDAVLTEWGLNPGLPKAARLAGLPAGQRPYQSGDSLAVARPATLYAFTDPGMASGMPARRPIVRIRHANRAMEAVILIDASPGLLVPARAGVPGKADLVTLLVRLLAGVVWASSGSVLVKTVQQPRSIWGPQFVSDDLEGLEAFIAGAIRTGVGPTARVGLEPPDELVPGHVLFLISDFLAIRVADVEMLIAHCAQEGVSLRAIRVFDPDEVNLVGLAVSAQSGRVLDRSEWASAELAAAYVQHAHEIARRLEAGGARFQSVPAGESPADIFDRLLGQGFLT